MTTESANIYMNMTDTRSKFVLGGMVGPESSCTANWCDWTLDHA